MIHTAIVRCNDCGHDKQIKCKEWLYEKDGDIWIKTERPQYFTCIECGSENLKDITYNHSKECK